MVGERQPPTDKGPRLSISVSLGEIYERLCPTCREALTDLLGEKAAAGGLPDAFRAKFEAQLSSSLPEGPQGEHR